MTMNHKFKFCDKIEGFTLLEIMIISAIVALLAVLAIPRFIRARKQSQGRRILNDIRQMDAAIDQWVLENGKKDGDPVDTTSAAIYLKREWKDTDTLNNPYVIGTVGTNQIAVAIETKAALVNIGIDWGAY